MPKDEWASSKAKDRARRARNTPAMPWVKLRGKKRKQARSTRQSWFEAIEKCKSNDELTAVARTIAVMYAAKKISEVYAQRLFAAGKRRRRQLANS